MPPEEPADSAAPRSRRRALFDLALVTAIIGAQIPSPAAVRAVTVSREPHSPTPTPTPTPTPMPLADGRTLHFLGFDTAPTSGLLTRIAAEVDSAVAAVVSAQSLAYDRAWWFARFIADRYGTAALKQLYVRAGGAAHLDSTTALRDVLGTEEAQLFSLWRCWLAR